MKRLNYLVPLLVLSLFAAGCDDSDPLTPPPNPGTIVDVAIAAGSFETLVDLVIAAASPVPSARS